MPDLLAAVTRDDVATYVNALFIVYIILIFARILMSYLPRVPYSVPLRAVMDFIAESTDPYLRIFRRFIPPIGGGFDVSPVVATFVLLIVQGIVVALIAG